MDGHSRKWMILGVTTWIMTFAGTNFDFSSYSSSLKSVLGISQLQLNFLSVASDFGKAFGWSCGVFLLYLPYSVVLSMAALLGFVGYGLQWLIIQELVTLPYTMVLILSLLAGCSVCWFSTVCYVLCIQNFEANCAFALSLVAGYNGVGAAIYTLIANAIDSSDSSLYLFLNSLLPLVVSIVALVLIPSKSPPKLTSAGTPHNSYDSYIFLLHYVLAVITGLYLLALNPLALDASAARNLLAGALFLLALPMCLPRLVYARDWLSLQESALEMPAPNDQELVELHKELVKRTERFSVSVKNREQSQAKRFSVSVENREQSQAKRFSVSVENSEEPPGFFGKVMRKDCLNELCQEHPAKLLLSRSDFWLYYFAYLCGGTVGFVYGNNLGQIAESLGHREELHCYVILFSTCSFFGRLLSAAPDFLHNKSAFARTGWFATSLLPTPISFCLLVASGSSAVLYVSTALIGLSSGLVISAAVSISSELFGPNSAGVNHNILITNIPIGSLLYGLLAAIIYDSNGSTSTTKTLLLGEEILCMGRKCFLQTFMWWTCISMFGLLCSFILYLRTKPAYESLGNRSQTPLP